MTPTTSKEMPLTRIVSPTAGLLPKSLRATSEPTKATRRRFSVSSALMKRPTSAVSLRMTPYSGDTPRTAAEVCLLK